LSRAELVELMKHSPPTAVAEVVQREGISFEPSEEVLEDLRKAGADVDVIAAARVSWHPECPVPLSEKDTQALAEHMPSEKFVDMVQRCGVGFQPTDGYLQGLRSSGARDELIEAVRIAAAKPFSRDQLLLVLASGEDAGQVGKGVQERGIDFDPTEEDLGKLRSARASEPLLEAIRDAKRVKQPVNQVPNAPEAKPPSPTGTSVAGATMWARVVCPPSLSGIPVFGTRNDMNATVGDLDCNGTVRILEKDSGRIGIDKIFFAGLIEGFVPSPYLDSSTPPRVTPPVPTYQPQPPYTPQARQAKIGGTVVLMIKIDEQGNVTEASETSKPLGEGLDEKAIEAVKKWKFKPATRYGVPVTVRATVEFTFRLFK
jgi:TonB family protein